MKLDRSAPVFIDEVVLTKLMLMTLGSIGVKWVDGGDQDAEQEDRSRRQCRE